MDQPLDGKHEERMLRGKWSLICGLLAAGPALWQAAANNLAITNVSLAPNGSGQAVIEFDLSWENSWRDATNYDACWAFVKYSTDGGTRWRHATMSASGTNPAGFSPGSNTDLTLIVPDDKKGVLIQRTANGTGDLISTNVQLAWNFTGDGVSSNASTLVKVLGLEMVYIPAGTFYVGDNTNGALSALAVTRIDSADMTKTNTAGSGTIADPYTNPTGCGRPGGVTGTFDAGYPNGYNAFYIMKYEMAEGMYVDFLNTLTLEQAWTRYPDLGGWYRHTIRGTFSTLGGSFTSAAPGRATVFCYINETCLDGAALVDWAALRPATEMEFEKAGRGPIAPAAINEYAWGNDTAPTAYATITGDGTDSETPNSLTANANFTTCTPDGPIRCGAFASNGSDRIKSGAGYYGIMELSGNVIDRVIPTGGDSRTGSSRGLSFSGLHGDGELTTDGMPNTAGWPIDGNYPYAGRSGGWQSGSTELAIAARRTWVYMYQAGLGGVRAARTAP